jgi:hypothetical protein
MIQEITVNYAEGQDSYQVTLEGNAVFGDVGIPADLKGEDRVAAIVAAGGVEKVLRAKNGGWHDGPDGQPAVQIFNDDGTLYRTAHHQEVIVNCGEGAEAYQVSLVGEGSLVFNNASLPADIKGEERVAAIFAAGGVSSIARDKDGEQNDGVNGEPAWQTFNDNGTPGFIEYRINGILNDPANGKPARQDFLSDGTPYFTERYQSGKKNDGPNGEPCVEMFWGNGKVSSVSRYKDDKYNNGATGEPAYQHFNENGTLSCEKLYTDGKLNDGPNGKPALQMFDNNGKLSFVAHYKDGKHVQRLSNVKRKLSNVLKRG